MAAPLWYLIKRPIISSEDFELSAPAHPRTRLGYSSTRGRYPALKLTAETRQCRVLPNPQCRLASSRLGFHDELETLRLSRIWGSRILSRIFKVSKRRLLKTKPIFFLRKSDRASSVSSDSFMPSKRISPRQCDPCR